MKIKHINITNIKSINLLNLNVRKLINLSKAADKRRSAGSADSRCAILHDSKYFFGIYKVRLSQNLELSNGSDLHKVNCFYNPHLDDRSICVSRMSNRRRKGSTKYRGTDTSLTHNSISKSRLNTTRSQPSTLSFYLSTPRCIYFIKRRVIFNESLEGNNFNIPFYTVDPWLIRLLRSISSGRISKVVYNDGFDLYQHFNNFFGVKIRNLVDLNFMYYLAMKLDSVNLETSNLSQVLRHKLIRESNRCSRDVDDIRNINRAFNFLLKTSLSFTKGGTIANKLDEICRRSDDIELRLYELMQKDVLAADDICTFKQILYQKIACNDDNHEVIPLVANNGILENSVKANTGVPMVMNGILKYRSEVDRIIVLCTNTYLFDKIRKSILPIYGIARGEYFKNFCDQIIGDLVSTTIESNKTTIQLSRGHAYLNVKRLHDEHLIYNLRKKRLTTLK